MGAGASAVRTEVQSEFATHCEAAGYATIHNLLQFKLPAHGIDLSHLGTLYVMNESKSGRFTLSELMRFIDLCVDRQRKFRQNDFGPMMRAYCSIRLWDDVTTSQGRHAFAEWFLLLLEVEDTVSMRTIYLLHSIFCLEQGYGLRVSDFHAMLTESMVSSASTETLVLGPSAAADASLGAHALGIEELALGSVSVQTVRNFAMSFVKGFASMMSSIGFDEAIDYDPK
eukprot:c49824_g1_i1.p2 GENE.c49824_g1_i1~~c49824_g1_i1.p2  ORF type:complete len:227 (+),score=41.90 c49824_g1_i1:95-775(+)